MSSKRRAGFSTDALMQEVKLLGHDVGIKVPFLQETSCMNPEQREEYAFLVITEELLEFTKKHPEDFSMEQFLGEFLKPSLQVWGYALWPRDILTDLAMRLGKKRKKVTWEPNEEREEDESEIEPKASF